MNETQKILHAVVAALGDASDYRVAKELGVSRQAVSKWRAGRNLMGDDAGLEAAKLLKVKPEVVLLKLAAERSNSDEAAAVWKRLQRTAAVLLVTTLAGLTAGQEARAGSPAASRGAGVCILCYLRRVGRFLRLFTELAPIAV